MTPAQPIRRILYPPALPVLMLLRFFIDAARSEHRSGGTGAEMGASAVRYTAGKELSGRPTIPWER